MKTSGNPVWWDPGHQKLGTPSLWRRVVGEPQWGIQVGQVAMHPGCVHDDFVVARFSAPVDGRYSLAVRVGPGDVGSVELAVVHDARILRREQEVRGAWAHETGPLVLRAGGALEFVVGVGPDQCFNDNVPVDLVVHQLAP